MNHGLLRGWVSAALFLLGLAAHVPAGNAAPLQDVLSLEEAAVLLRVDVATVRSLAEAQSVPARRVGDDWRFARDALLEWLKGERFAGMAIVPPAHADAGEAPAVRGGTTGPSEGVAQAAPDAGGQATAEENVPAVPTAGQIALRDQRVLLRGGALTAELGVSYAHGEQSVYPIARVEQSTTAASATLRYGLKDDLQVTLRLPAAERRTTIYTDPSVAGTAPVSSTHQRFLGDAAISLLGVASREAMGRPNVIWSIDSVVPTGSGDSGFGGGMVLSKSFDPAVLFGGFSFLRGLSVDPVDPKRSLAKNNLGLNLGYTYALNDTLALNALVTGLYRNTQSPNGTAIPPSRERYQLQLGMTWMISPRLFVEPAVGIRLGGDVPDVVLSLNMPYTF